MRIRTRIVSLVTILLILMSLASAFSLFEIRSIGTEIVGVTEEDIPLSNMVMEIAAAQLEQSIVFERGLRYGMEPFGTDRFARAPFDKAQKDFEILGERIYRALAQGKVFANKVFQARADRPSRRELDQAIQKLAGIEEVYRDYERHAKEVFRLVDTGDTKQAEIEALSITVEEERLRSLVRSALRLVSGVTDESAERSARVKQDAQRFMLAFALVTITVGVTLAILITTSITRPLGRAVHIAEQIAVGNKEIDIRTDSPGEVGQLLTAMREMLSAVVESERVLREQAEELTRSNKELEQFAYVASHDLQEPLRMVASYTQLLAKRYKDKLDADANEFISYAVGGVTRMQNLINDLLLYSRVGRKEKALQPVSLSQAVDQAKENLRAAIDESSAEVEVGPLPTVTGDLTLLTQLFQNLLGNAIKFRGSNVPKIAVRAMAQNKQGEWQVRVVDNGIGIDPQFADRIFNIFQRLHTQAEYSGTGIGLAICRKIVERHGGRIWVESSLGSGAQFCFTFPMIGDRNEHSA